jgi:hypothetical protein
MSLPDVTVQHQRAKSFVVAKKLFQYVTMRAGYSIKHTQAVRESKKHSEICFSPPQFGCYTQITTTNSILI